MSKVLESMYVPKERYLKLELEMQALKSELTFTISRIEELHQELELSEARRVNSENRVSRMWNM